MFHMQSMRAFFFGLAALRTMASIGYSGVSFFFVLSGFILVYTYSGRATTLRAFWQARFARIYPFYLLHSMVIMNFH
jgi:peptidoglycan/LPS O-acetylase OafA/YrhL